MSLNADELAAALFEWLNGIDGRGSEGGVYSFNGDPDTLVIGVDGYVDCKKVAKFLVDRTENRND